MRILPIIDIDLSKTGEQTIPVVGANRLWLPPSVLRTIAGVPKLVAQVTDAILAIRFEQTNEPIVFGVGESMANAFSGDFDRLYVTVVQNSATANAHLYLMAGQDVAVNYGNASGLSPMVTGGGGGTQPTTGNSNFRLFPVHPI